MPSGGDLSEPSNGGRTGETPAETSVSNLNHEYVAASRFLAQATFGPTPATIVELKSKSNLDNW